MSRSKTGPLLDKDFENDALLPMPHVDQLYSPAFITWRDEFIAKVKSQVEAAHAAAKK